MFAGPQQWQLPIATVQFPQGLERNKYFAQFLLMGRISKKLRKFCKDLLSPPETMIKPFAQYVNSCSTFYISSDLGVIHL